MKGQCKIPVGWKNQANNFDNSPERLILFKNRLNINSERFNLISIINPHLTEILH